MLGKQQDTRSNDLFTYIVHQAFLVDIPYNPILHDLANSSRLMSAPEIVEYWLDMFETQDVTEWKEAFEIVDIPPLQKTFSEIQAEISSLHRNASVFLSPFGLGFSWEPCSFYQKLEAYHFYSFLLRYWVGSDH